MPAGNEFSAGILNICQRVVGERETIMENVLEIRNLIKDYPGVRLTRTHYVLRTVKNIHSSGFETER